jgi:hypothetical protein
MLFRRLSVQPEPLDDGEYDSDASDDDVTEHELIDAAKAAASGDIEVLEFLLVTICVQFQTITDTKLSLYHSNLQYYRLFRRHLYVLEEQ